MESASSCDMQDGASAFAADRTWGSKSASRSAGRGEASCNMRDEQEYRLTFIYGLGSTVYSFFTKSAAIYGRNINFSLTIGISDPEDDKARQGNHR